MVYQKIVDFLHTKLANRSAIIGISGGVDSAVVLYLLTLAIPTQNIQAFYLPSVSNTKEDKSDAEFVTKLKGINLSTIAIDSLVAEYQKLSSDFIQGLPLMNLKSRIRMSILYGRANLMNGLVVGTGNKTELLTGYFTKYGDGGVDLLPLGGLYKTEVWELAKQLNLPKNIINKTPTAGLQIGQTDEADLGMSYKQLDNILQALESNKALIDFPVELVNKVKLLKQRAFHKLNLPPMA